MSVFSSSKIFSVDKSRGPSSFSTGDLIPNPDADSLLLTVRGGEELGPSYVLSCFRDGKKCNAGNTTPSAGGGSE